MYSDGNTTQSFTTTSCSQAVCMANDIPTLGEWGLITLGFIVYDYWSCPPFK